MLRKPYFIGDNKIERTFYVPNKDEINYDGVRNSFYKVFSRCEVNDHSFDRFEKESSYKEMAMHMLEQSSEIGPLLLDLCDNHKTYAFKDKTDYSLTNELSAIMVDLASVELKQEQKELVTDILLSLLRQAEKDLRSAISERAAVLDNVSSRMVVYLANDEIEVAAPILEKSKILEDKDLISIIKNHAEDHWWHIAKRDEMSTQVIDTLVETHDETTAVILSENQKLKLTNYALDEFTKMARKSENLAKPLLMREEISSYLAMRLYEYVGIGLKSYIRDNFNTASSNTSTNIVDDIVFEMNASAKGDFTPTVNMIKAAEEMYKRGMLDTIIMLKNLRRGQINNYIAQFSVYCSVKVETVEEILRQNSGQALAVTCKAIGISKSDFVNMYLLTQRVRGGRIIDQKELSSAISYYQRVTEEMACEILSQTRH